MVLQINTGEVVLPLCRDGKQTGTLTLNPKDVNFVQRFYDLCARYEALQTALREKAQALKPDDVKGYFALIAELGQEVRESIDACFGEGTCQAAFGDFIGHPDVYAQFFDGITAVVTEQRQAQMAPYLPDADADADASADALV